MAVRRLALTGLLLIATAGIGLAAQEDAEEGGPAQAPPSPLTGMLIGSWVERQSSDRYNPGNEARMPRSAYELAAVMDYQGQGLSARLRASAVARDVPNGIGNPPVRDTRLDLTQLRWTRALTDRWSVSLGRMNLGFDEGQSYHPLDFFEDTVRGTDFEDRAARNRGFPLVMLERTLISGGVRWIYSDDRTTGRDYVYGDANPNFNRGQRQMVMSWRQSQGLLTWTVLVQRAWPGHTGVGTSWSWTPGAAWSVYGAAFSAPGNSWPVHRSVADRRTTGLDARDVHAQTSPLGPWQADDGRWRLRVLMGGQYTWEGGDGLQLEVWRDGRGMDRDEWRLWKQLRAFHDNLAHPLARQANLAYDLSALRAPGGTHLFGRYTRPLSGRSTLQASVLFAQDASGSAGLRWQGSLGASGDLSLEIWRRFGAQDSLYRAFPDRQGVSFLWRLFL